MQPAYLIYLGLAVALVYLPMTGTAPTWPRTLVKTIPLVAFGVAAWLSAAPAFLIAGLFFSALGDLALSRRGEAWFLYGLASFALAHLVYIPHFLQLSGGNLWGSFALFPLIAVFLLALTLTTELWLAPHVGNLRWPVRAYVIVITCMGLAALTLPLGMITLGAGLFIASDMILALQLFRMGEDNPLVGPAGWAIWVFYIMGQLLILTGSLA